MDAVEEVKSRLDIVDIVGDYLQLKPSGSGSFKANCPFHQEKTPSFYVNRPRQSWHCFGCDQGGDMISFVQRMEGMEFPEALSYLAEKAGVELPKYDMKNSSEKKRLHEVNDLATRFFRGCLNNLPQAEIARAYVTKRQLDDLTTDIWRLGYAPDSWDLLTKALKEKEVAEDEMLRAGLVLKSDRGGVYDRFRGRLMFPIADVHGNVVGFTGRIIDGVGAPLVGAQDDMPNKAGARPAPTGNPPAKYVNTPETAVYKKSNVLYGLDKAKGEIKRKDLAVIVEGNMDVIGSHQFNVTNVVCSSGTALTSEQLNLLKRFTTNLAIAFDADAAGNAATIRGLDLARTLDFSIKIITLPPEAGKDPDDAVRKDPELWKQAITDALPVVEWLYRNAFRQSDTSTPEGKKMVAAMLLPELKHISNAVERDAWMNRLAKDLGVSEDALREAMKAVGAPLAGARSGRTDAHADRPAEGRPQGSPLPEKHIRTTEDELFDRIHAAIRLKPELEPLAESLLGEYYRPISPDIEHLNFLAVLGDREYQDQSIDILRREMETDCELLKGRLTADRRTLLEQEMRDAERTGDTSRIADLIAQFNHLNH